MEFRTVYTNPPDKVAVSDFGPTRTKQEFKDECDINRIMKRYATTGILPPGRGLGRYGDFSQVGEFRDAQETILRARDQFESLPAEVRDRFRNDPIRFLEFVTDKKNFDEAVSLGLLSDEAVARDKAEKLAKEAAKAAAAAPAVPAKEVK